MRELNIFENVMNHTNHQLSAKLEKLGCTSESGLYWEKITTHEWSLGKDSDTDGYHDGVKVINGDLFSMAFKNGDDDVMPAYTFSDIMKKENLVRLFGEGYKYYKTEPFFKPTLLYKTHGKKLLEAYWQSWKVFEEYLERYI